MPCERGLYSDIKKQIIFQKCPGKVFLFLVKIMQMAFLLKALTSKQVMLKLRAYIDMILNFIE